MQLINLALSLDVLELPHPLLAHSIHFHGIGGWAAEAEVNHRAPGKHEHGDQKWDYSPSEFEQCGAVDLLRFRMGVAAVADGKKDKSAEDYRAEKHEVRHQEKVKIIHLVGAIGRGIGE